MTDSFVDQTILDANATPPGNCWQACVASLLGLPLADVPHFVHEFHAGYSPNWWTATQDFVADHRPGWELRCLTATFPVYTADYRATGAAPPYVILSGDSPRGLCQHAVIADAVTGEIVHDPHPSRAGLLFLIDVCALVPIEAA
jgi:hypothetical protein